MARKTQLSQQLLQCLMISNNHWRSLKFLKKISSNNRNSKSNKQVLFRLKKYKKMNSLLIQLVSHHQRFQRKEFDHQNSIILHSRINLWTISWRLTISKQIKMRCPKLANLKSLMLKLMSHSEILIILIQFHMEKT